MYIYLIVSGGRVSSEAYKTLEEARSYILRKLEARNLKLEDMEDVYNPDGYISYSENGITTEIRDVRVLG